MSSPSATIDRLKSSLTSRTTSDATLFLTVYLVLLLAVPSNRSILALGSAGSVSVVWGVGAAILWILYRVQKTEPSRGGVAPLHVALFVFGTATLASYIAAMTRALPAEEISVSDTGLIRLVAWSGIVLVAADGITTLERFLTFVRRLVLAAGALSALGIAQFVTKLSLVDALGLPGLSVSASYSAVEIRGGLVRAAGTANHPLEYAMVLAMILPLALTLALRETNRSWLLRWSPVVLIAVALVLSGSRSAVIGILAGVLVLIPTWSRSVRWLLLVAGLALGAVVYLVSPLVVTNMRYLFLAIFEDPSAASRSDSLGLFVHLFQLNPTFGRGFGSFLPMYRILDNQYLLFILEIGLVGLLAFLGLAVCAVVCALHAGRRSVDPVTHDLGFALAGSVVSGVVILSLFDALSFPQSAGLLFLVFGLCGAFWQIQRPPVGAAIRLPARPSKDQP